jgi:hypothetical protein
MALSCTCASLPPWFEKAVSQRLALLHLSQRYDACDKVAMSIMMPDAAYAAWRSKPFAHPAPHGARFQTAG